MWRKLTEIATPLARLSFRFPPARMEPCLLLRVSEFLFDGEQSALVRLAYLTCIPVALSLPYDEEVIENLHYAGEVSISLEYHSQHRLDSKSFCGSPTAVRLYLTCASHRLRL